MKFREITNNIKWLFFNIFLSKEQLAWKISKSRNLCFLKGDIIPLNEYSIDAPIYLNNKKRVVCIYDSKRKSGGLADRLRGVVSIYELCKEYDLDFKLIFNHPFEITKFLEPNIIDWRISKEELNYNTTVTDICCIETIIGSKGEVQKQKRWFRKEFKKKYSEFHIRTNAKFSYYSDFSSLFHELFKLSSKLQASIDKQKELIGECYISTSFRFMNLLHDFSETCPIEQNLTLAERKELISQNIEQIKKLHKQYPNKKILVNSDSTTFLKHAAILNYVYIIPGNITHIDGENVSNEYIIYEKTFLDFFMIANAEKIYLLRTGSMYDSGYPYAASKIYNKPFEKIEF